MRTGLIALAAITLFATPSLAQAPAPDEHKAHHPDAAANTTAGAGMDMSKMTPEEMHKHCTMIMGGEMKGAPKHNHSSDRLGHAPTYKAPTEAEMKAMHEKCAAHMSEDKKR